MCCSLVVISFVVRSWFIVDGLWSISLLVSVLFVGCYVICCSLFVVGSLLVDDGPWSMSLLVSVLLVGCYVIRRS